MRPATYQWSLRRELWEHRSVFYVPIALGLIVLAGWLVGGARHLQPLLASGKLEPARRATLIAMPFSLAASVILLAGVIVAVFYCLDTLSAERRDRSILFWKSMPVSDTTTVLAKATVPFVILPLVGFCVALAVQMLMLATGTTFLPMQWSELPLGEMTLVMAYGLAVHSLWFAPLYGYLMLVSSWARRAPFLWAVLPLFAIGIAEKVALDTSWFASAMRYRLTGAMAEAFALGATQGPITHLSQLTPARFLASPNVWLGLVFGVASIYAAIRLRRHREHN